MSDFKKWLPWLLSIVLVTGLSLAAPAVSGGGCSSCLLRSGDTATGTLNSSVGSGTNAFAATVNGARIDVGTGSDDYLKSDGASIIVGGGLGAANSTLIANELEVATNGGIFLDTSGTRRLFWDGTQFSFNNGDLSVGSAGAGYIKSGTPITLASVYVNNIPSVFTYGGGKLPAHAFTVTAVKFNVRTAGSGGSTNVTFQTTDGTNTCNCTYACNHATGADRAACANGAGTGCVYAASAVLQYKFTGVGDCATTSADLEGNVDVEGNWQ